MLRPHCPSDTQPGALLRRGNRPHQWIAALLLSFAFKASAWGADKVTCSVASKYILSRSAAGDAQVSNRGSLEMECSVPARPVPNKPGQFRLGLTVSIAAYAVLPGGGKKLVPSEASTSGGSDNGTLEGVNFNVRIPLEPRELDDEAQRFIAKAKEESAKSTPPQLMTEQEEQGLRKGLGAFFPQQRVGRYLLECHVLDGDRLIGTGDVHVEVLFKGHYLDPLPSSPPSQTGATSQEQP